MLLFQIASYFDSLLDFFQVLSHILIIHEAGSLMSLMRDDLLDDTLVQVNGPPV